MQNETVSEQTLWEEMPYVLPPHSRLYDLIPCGIGTPYVESLTSYVMRLAEAHSVSLRDLLIHELAPQLRPLVHQETGHLKAGAVSRFLRQSVALNGLRVTAKQLAEAMNMLTGRGDLQMLTFLPWADAISVKKLLRRTKAWCPFCLESWRETSQPCYEPLLWSVECLSMCPLHSEPFSTCCPFCACASAPLTSRSQPGYCSWCHRWLGQPFEGRANRGSYFVDDPWKIQRWIASQVGEVLAAVPSFSQPLHREDALAVLSTFVHRELEGRLTRAARSLSLTDPILRQWLYGNHVPQLRNLLQACCALGISLLSLLLGTADAFPQAGKRTWQLPPSEPLRKPFREFDAEIIHHALQQAWEDSSIPPLSVNQIAQQLRYRPHQLTQLFPELCQAISSRYSRYQEQQRRSRYQSRCEEVRQAVFHLHAQGIHPSEVRVKQRLQKPSILRFPEVRAAWKMARHEVGVK